MYRRHITWTVRKRNRSVAATPDQVSANGLSKSVIGAIPGAWHTNIPSLFPTAHSSFPELGACCTSPIPPHIGPNSAISDMGAGWHPMQMGNHLRQVQVHSHRAGSPWSMAEKIGGFHPALSAENGPRTAAAARNCRMLAPLWRADGCSEAEERGLFFDLQSRLLPLETKTSSPGPYSHISI